MVKLQRLIKLANFILPEHIHFRELGDSVIIGSKMFFEVGGAGACWVARVSGSGPAHPLGRWPTV